MMGGIIQKIRSKIGRILLEPNKKRVRKEIFSHPESMIHHSFPDHRLSIFQGKGNEYGKIMIEEGFSCRDYCTILVFPNAYLTIGKSVFLNNCCSINCLDSIEIGSNTLFGEGVKIYDHNHLIFNDNNQIAVSKDQFSTAPVKIGSNCWIASNVTILKGVTIGDNVVIGANCLIHKSIPSNTIVKNNQQLKMEHYD